MSEEKKCSYCAMMIPKEAKVCPHCRKKMPMSGPKIIIISVIGFLLVWFVFILPSMNAPSRTPPAGNDPKTATDDQIYREYEICMNSAKKTINDDKLKGQKIAALCFAQLQKYGDARAKKAFSKYFE